MPGRLLWTVNLTNLAVLGRRLVRSRRRTGYEVAWKITGADRYTVWITDNSGNYVSSVFDVASGSSAAVNSLETSFHQDLNSDGWIGPPPPPPTVIENSDRPAWLAMGAIIFFSRLAGRRLS